MGGGSSKPRTKLGLDVNPTGPAMEKTVVSLNEMMEHAREKMCQAEGAGPSVLQFLLESLLFEYQRTGESLTCDGIGTLRQSITESGEKLLQEPTLSESKQLHESVRYFVQLSTDIVSAWYEQICASNDTKVPLVVMTRLAQDVFDTICHQSIEKRTIEARDPDNELTGIALEFYKINLKNKQIATPLPRSMPQSTPGSMPQSTPAAGSKDLAVG